jgi:hypothetical protein
LLFAFYRITGAWRLWIFLWPLEPLLVGATVVFTIWLSRQGDRGRQMARHLGRALVRPALVATFIVVVLGTIFGS